MLYLVIHGLEAVIGALTHYEPDTLHQLPPFVYKDAILLAKAILGRVEFREAVKEVSKQHPIAGSKDSIGSYVDNIIAELDEGIDSDEVEDKHGAIQAALQSSHDLISHVEKLL